MEDVVIRPDFWRAKRVFVTGHTGFKGGWLSVLFSQVVLFAANTLYRMMTEKEGS